MAANVAKIKASEEKPPPTPDKNNSIKNIPNFHNDYLYKKNQLSASSKLPPFFIIRATKSLRNFLLGLGRRMMPPAYVMLEHASSFWKAKAIEVAARLNIAAHLQGGPMHISDLSALCKTDEQALYRLMRLLCGEGIFKEKKGKIFVNNKMSETLLDSSPSVKYYILHHLGDTNWDLVNDLENCVITGENAIKRKYDTDAFTLLEKNPLKSSIFNRAMADTVDLAGALMLKSYHFGKFKKIIDVGGGQGNFLALIASKYPETEFMLFDKSNATEKASALFSRSGLEKNCSILNGNFFESVPSGAGLYILKNVLHDWKDAEATLILKNIAAAMLPGSRLLVIEAIIKANNKTSIGKYVDLQMLIGTDGGRERSLDEFMKLYHDSGLTLLRIIDNATDFSFMELSRKNL